MAAALPRAVAFFVNSGSSYMLTGECVPLHRPKQGTSLTTAGVFMCRPRTSVRIYNSASDELKNMHTNSAFLLLFCMVFFSPKSGKRWLYFSFWGKSMLMKVIRKI